MGDRDLGRDAEEPPCCSLGRYPSSSGSSAGCCDPLLLLLFDVLGRGGAKACDCGVGREGGQALPSGLTDGGAVAFGVGILIRKDEDEQGPSSTGARLVGGERLLGTDGGGGVNAALAATLPARSIRLDMRVMRLSGPGSNVGSSSESAVSSGGGAACAFSGAAGAWFAVGTWSSPG